MAKTSAGLVIYDNDFRILLVHPGGPYWEDIDSWSIPKGEMKAREDPLVTALRESKEELGQTLQGKMICLLGTFRQSKHKNVIAFAYKGTVTLPVQSNVIEIEWPRNSKKMIEISEVDKAEWFTSETALTKVHKGQRQIIERFISIISIL